jgi:hypothetical protein
MSFTPPAGFEVDQAKVGTKGYPRHWEALGLQPPLRPVIDVRVDHVQTAAAPDEPDPPRKRRKT